MGSTLFIRRRPTPCADMGNRHRAAPLFDLLPAELLSVIYCFIPSLKGRRHFMRVCRRFYRAHCTTLYDRKEYYSHLTLPRSWLLNDKHKTSKPGIFYKHIQVFQNREHGPARYWNIIASKSVPNLHHIPNNRYTLHAPPMPSTTRLSLSNDDWYIYDIDFTGLSCTREGEQLIPWTWLNPIFNTPITDPNFVTLLKGTFSLLEMRDDEFIVTLLTHPDDFTFRRNEYLHVKCVLRVQWRNRYETMGFEFTWSNPSNLVRQVLDKMVDVTSTTMFSIALMPAFRWVNWSRNYPFGLIEALQAWPLFHDETHLLYWSDRITLVSE